MFADSWCRDYFLVLASCAIYTALAGCNASTDAPPRAALDPKSPPREDANQPADRIAQLDAFGRSGDRAHMPAIIDALDDESVQVRAAAALAARRLVGSAIPFRADASAEKRAREIDAYRRLWQRAEETNTEYLIDLVPVLLDDMESDDPQEREQAVRDVVLLTGVTFGYRGDQPPEIRQALLERHRKLWSAWNNPGNTILDGKRRP